MSEVYWKGHTYMYVSTQNKGLHLQLPGGERRVVEKKHWLMAWVERTKQGHFCQANIGTGSEATWEKIQRSGMECL